MWARREAARLRAHPKTDMYDQIKQDCWPNPTREQRHHARLVEAGHRRWSVSETVETVSVRLRAKVLGDDREVPHERGEVLDVPRAVGAHLVMDGAAEPEGWTPDPEEIREAARRSVATLEAEMARLGALTHEKSEVYRHGVPEVLLGDEACR